MAFSLSTVTRCTVCNVSTVTRGVPDDGGGSVRAPYAEGSAPYAEGTDSGLGPSGIGPKYLVSSSFNFAGLKSPAIAIDALFGV